MDENDSDPRTVLTYVLAAIRPLFPEIKLHTELLLEANPLPPVPVLAGHLLNDFQVMPGSFILVLDDFHRTRGIFVQDLITELPVHLSQKMHLVLLTRRDPPLPLGGLRGRGQITEIRLMNQVKAEQVDGLQNAGSMFSLAPIGVNQ